MQNQRSKKETIEPEHKKRLDYLDFDWEPMAERWEHNFNALISFREEHGNCLVPARHKTASGFRLGRWVSRQRTDKEQLTSERVQRLDDLGFVWKVKKG